MKNSFITFTLGFLLLTIFNSCQKEPPVFSIGYSGDLFEGHSVSFQASSTAYDNYLWDFGDGSFGGGPSYTNTYASPGTYTVQLTVTSGGKNYTSTKEITIKPIPTQIKIKKITILDVDYQSNWDPQDFSGPDIYVRLTQDVFVSGATNSIELYRSPTVANVTANLMPLVYTPNPDLYIPFGSVFRFNINDEDGNSFQAISNSHSFGFSNELPFTSTTFNLNFPFTGTSVILDIEYIF